MEQREYIPNAITLLKNSAFAQVLNQRIKALAPKLPSTAGYTQATDPGQKFTCGTLELNFGKTGSIIHLVETGSGRVWTDSVKNPIGEYSYTTYSQDDYMNYLRAYTPCEWSQCSGWEQMHGKFNMSEAHPEHNDFLPSVQSLWSKTTGSSCEFLVNFKILDSQAYIKYGGATDYWSYFSVGAASGTIRINATFQWFEKTTTRLPEAHWFTFNPSITSFNPRAWQMDKLGSLVSPLDIVTNGSHNIHGINPLTGITYSDSNSYILLHCLDIPIVAPGKPWALPAPFVVPDLTLGWSYLLHANIWGTNWPLWYPFDPADHAAMYRFQLTLQDKKSFTSF